MLGKPDYPKSGTRINPLDAVMVRRTNLEVANIIEAFVEGTGGDWDWDDFCSLQIENRELDAIRIKCCQLDDTHPPVVRGHYCNDEGIGILREMVRNLRGLPS